ncbi:MULTISPECIES: methionine ABC transporter ATP-binding protein [Brenneria]|nr:MULTISPECIES: ATP-binding cassette domain-containing protein [Brenneria]EHD20631.1 Phosphonate-transporting ATPase [Brenneria sp. EniD312]
MSLAGVVMKTILDWGKTAAGAQSVAGASSDVSAPRGASGSSVTFERLSRVYPSPNKPVQALTDISLTIPAGCIFGIIGRSGAGKSSLLRTINRLERPTVGRVLIDDVDISTLDENQLVNLRRRVGMIFQHFNLLAARTVWENVALPLRVADVPQEQIERRVAELLALVGLQDKRNVYPSRLSGGQKQRVGIARALATAPDVLLCDEATSALDPETTQSILQLLRDINRRLGITIVVITHEMSVIREIAERVLVLEQGRIAELGEVWRVFGSPQHEATKALLAPLQHGVPDDLLRRLRPQPASNGDGDRIWQLSYSGEGGLEPDFTRIAQALQTPVRLVYGGMDRIQGHAHGRLLLAASAAAPLPDFTSLTQGPQAIAHQIEVIGYVPFAFHSA